MNLQSKFMENYIKTNHVLFFTLLGLFAIELLRGGNLGDILSRTAVNILILFILYCILMPFFKEK